MVIGGGHECPSTRSTFCGFVVGGSGVPTHFDPIGVVQRGYTTNRQAVYLRSKVRVHSRTSYHCLGCDLCTVFVFCLMFVAQM